MFDILNLGNVENVTRVGAVTGLDIMKIVYVHLPLICIHLCTWSTMLVTQKLLTTENYTSWSKSMQMNVVSKHKIGFIDDNVKRIMSFNFLHSQWDRCKATYCS